MSLPSKWGKSQIKEKERGAQKYPEHFTEKYFVSKIHLFLVYLTTYVIWMEQVFKGVALKLLLSC